MTQLLSHNLQITDLVAVVLVYKSPCFLLPILILVLNNFTTRPRENLLVGVGVDRHFVSTTRRRNFFGVGGGRNNVVKSLLCISLNQFHHETKRFSFGRGNVCFYIFIWKFTTRPRELLLVAGGM
jgi:hypothetical protein